MRDKQRRTAQRRVNKLIRVLNKDIENDPLWKGRFYAHQMRASWYRFEDNSGGELNLEIRLTDKKTGYIKNIYLDNYNIDWHLWLEMNNFIVEDCQVWQHRDTDNPYKDTTDYRKMR